MNVMKVTINRPWLSAQLFNKTEAYVRLEESPFSVGFNAKDLPAAIDASSNAHILLQNANSKQFPGYPVAFLVAKDVSIKITTSAQSAKDCNTFVEETVSKGVRSTSYDPPWLTVLTPLLYQGRIPVLQHGKGGYDV